MPRTTSPIEGVWKLVSFKFFAKGDENRFIYSPLGEKPSGRIIFTPDGYMSATLTSSEVLQASEGVMWPLPEDDYITRIARPMTTYCGPFSLSKSEGKDIVTTKVDLALDPNWIGGDQTREWTIQQRQAIEVLILRPTQAFPGPDGNEMTGVLVWQRVSNESAFRASL